MRSRWSVLALLFFIRGTMAVQFQSVAAIAPLLPLYLTALSLGPRAGLLPRAGGCSENPPLIG